MSGGFAIVYDREEKVMANIHDPKTWGAFNDRTKITLIKIREMFFNQSERCDKCWQIDCVCEVEDGI